MTRRVTSSPRRALPGLLAVVVASIVFGIVGMHALATHAVMGTSDHSDVTGPVASSMTGVHDMSTGPAVHTAAGHRGMSSTAHDGGDGHGLGSMVMLCFAMLAATAGALLLLFLGVRRRSRVWAHRLAAPFAVAVTRWVRSGLGAGPPYVWQFSVIRC